MICKAFDKQTIVDNYIGEFLVKFSSDMRRTFKDNYGKQVEFIYKKPEWLPVLNDFIDIGDKCFGKVLMTFALFRK